MKKNYLKFIYYIYKKSRGVLQKEYEMIKDIDIEFWEEWFV